MILSIPIFTLLLVLISPSRRNRRAVHFSSTEEQVDMTLPGMSDVSISGGDDAVLPDVSYGLSHSHGVPS